MSFQEKKTIASILSGILVLGAYCIYAFSKLHSGAILLEDIQFFAVTMLIFIGIGIGATIVIQILFHIMFSIGVAIKNKIRDESIGDKDIEKIINVEMKEDERDRQIELKSMRFGYAFAGMGFVAGLAVLAWNGQPAVMLNVMYLSLLVGTLIEGFVQLFHYHRGY